MVAVITGKPSVELALPLWQYFRSVTANFDVYNLHVRTRHIDSVQIN